MMLDSHGRKPTKNLKIRPVSIFVTILVIALIAFIAGSQLNSDSGIQSLVPKHMQLQRQYEKLHSELAESRALHDLKEQQLESIKQELLAQQSLNSELSQRLRMLESILEARKAGGLQLLSAEAKWSDKETIQYNLTLVKGGNYPRYISGYLKLTTLSPESEAVEIELKSQKTRLPFRTETHTFLRGSAKWEHDWQPEKITATLFNSRGKELLQHEIILEGAPK